MTSSAGVGTERYTCYLSIEDQVKPWLRFLRVNTSFDEALTIITEGCCTAVQRFLGAPIAPILYSPDDGLGKFDGAAGLYSGYIMLPRTPVLQVVSVIEYQGNNPVQLAEIVNPGAPSEPNNPYPLDGFQTNYRTGRITRVLGGIWNRPFYPGSNNIWVTWLAGYNPIPTDIVMVTLNWIGRIFKQGFEASAIRPPAPGEEGGGGGEAKGLWLGIPGDVKALLQTYLAPGVA
jgi:hypothetical protein